MFLFVIPVFLCIFVEMTLFTKSAEACEVAAFSKEKKLKYEVEKMNERDIRAQRKYAERVSREEGREEGREEERLSIAKKLFEAGTPIDVIISCTGIDKSAAEALSGRS